MVVGNGITASIDPRSERKTAVVLYLIVIHKCSLINLRFLFIQSLVDSHNSTYTHPILTNIGHLPSVFWDILKSGKVFSSPLQEEKIS